MEWLYILSPIAIMGSAWWASSNAVNAIESSRQANLDAIKAGRDANQKSIETAECIARKKSAIDMIMLSQSNTRLHEAYRKIKVMHESSQHDISKYAQNDHTDLYDTANDIAYVLNHFEHVANGINQGIFDEETVRRSQWGTITSLYQYCKKFIETVREKNRMSAYSELEKLAKKWADNPLEKDNTVQ